MTAEVGIRKSEVGSADHARRWPRFGLRTLFVSITALGMLFGAAMMWLHAQESEYQRQAKAAKGLAKFGEVTWQTQAPAWMKWASDWRAFQRITKLDCHGGVVSSQTQKLLNTNDGVTTEQLLEAVAQVPTISELALDYYLLQSDDGTIEKLKQMKQLRNLDVKVTLEFWNHEAFMRSGEREQLVDKLVEKLQEQLPGVYVRKCTMDLL